MVPFIWFGLCNNNWIYGLSHVNLFFEKGWYYGNLKKIFWWYLQYVSIRLLDGLVDILLYGMRECKYIVNAEIIMKLYVTKQSFIEIWLWQFML